VHLAHKGHPLLGDPVYGRPPARRLAALPEAAQAAIAGFKRQALHAATLGFRHPVTGRPMSFASPLPPDMAALIAALG
jgi:23S rRNA pseudouridine1911/1915/1917 synthase